MNLEVTQRDGRASGTGKELDWAFYVLVMLFHDLGAGYMGIFDL